MYGYGRSDVNTICQWVCTAPKDLPPEQEEAFFKETYDYLNSLYGEKNCIQAVVHKDEGVKDRDGNILEGQAHMHYIFIPVVENPKFDPAEQKAYFEKLDEYSERREEKRARHEALDVKEPLRKACTYEEKVCADQVIRRRTLQEFHPNYQKWLDDHGIRASVYTGVTGGSNRTVEELKEKTKDELLEQERTLNKELESKLEMQSAHNKTTDVWGRDRSVDSWGRDRSADAWDREREDRTWNR